MSGWLAFALLYAWGTCTIFTAGEDVPVRFRLALGLLWPLVIFYLPKHRAKRVAEARARARRLEEPAYRQALADQQNADYPGCVLGLMECRSQTCGCESTVPCEAFVLARAKRIAARENPDVA